MADLTELQAAQTIKIAGADSTGQETVFANVNANGQLKVVQSLIGAGVEGALTVGTSAVELKVGGSKLTNRNYASCYNNSLAVLYWGFTSGVTTSTGTPLYPQDFKDWDISDGANSTIYLIAATASNNSRITENI